MTRLGLPFLQCCHGRSMSSQTMLGRQHLMCKRKLCWRGSAQSLRTPHCWVASVSHGKRDRVHTSPIPDLLSTAIHLPTLQKQQHGKPRGRNGRNVLPVLSGSTVPMTRDCCLLHVGVRTRAPCWAGTSRAVLIHNLSKEMLLNIPDCWQLRGYTREELF